LFHLYHHKSNSLGQRSAFCYPYPFSFNYIHTFGNICMHFRFASFKSLVFRYWPRILMFNYNHFSSLSTNQSTRKNPSPNREFTVKRTIFVFTGPPRWRHRNANISNHDSSQTLPYNSVLWSPYQTVSTYKATASRKSKPNINTIFW